MDNDTVKENSVEDLVIQMQKLKDEQIYQLKRNHLATTDLLNKRADNLKNQTMIQAERIEGFENELVTAHWIIENKDWLIKRLCYVSAIAIVGFGTSLYFLLTLISMK